MINKNEFTRLQKEYNKHDVNREALIKKSREVVKESKSLIYSVHRDEMQKASKLKEKIKDDLKRLVALTTKNKDLYFTGSIKIAEQEFVEAVCFYEYVKNNKIPTAKELGVTDDNYILGLCDLVGEVTRRSTNLAIKGKFDAAITAKEFVTELYFQLSKFDFRNSEIRRKYDGIKYELKKLESLVLELKLKGMI